MTLGREYVTWCRMIELHGADTLHFYGYYTYATLLTLGAHAFYDDVSA